MWLTKTQLAIVAAIAIVAGTATYMAISSGGRTYAADTTLIVPNQNGNFNSDAVTAIPQPALLPSDYVTVATSAPVLENVLRIRGIAHPTERQLTALRQRLTVTNGPPSAANTDSGSSDSVTVVAQAGTADGASRLADQVTKSLVDWDSARLQQRVRTLLTVARAAALGNTTPSVRNRADSMIAALKLTSVKSALSVVAPAAEPTTPVAPHPARDGVLAFLAAALLAYGGLLYHRRVPGTVTIALGQASIPSA
jgi:capsular polysaccharide biosynthesis protein